MSAAETTQQQQGGVKTYTGGCHCGAARFEADLDLGRGVSRCNCSICLKLGSTGALTKPDAVRLVAGGEHLGEYRTSGNAGRLFCARCGVYLFGRGDVPELGGAFCSVNVNTLDGVDPWALPVVYFDGRHDNWDAGPRSTPWPL